MPKGKYSGISLEVNTMELAEKYRKDSGFTSIAQFVSYLIRTYPLIAEEIKEREKKIECGK